jgi:hypothetical protein
MKHPKSTDAYTGGHLDVYLPFDSVELSSSEDVWGIYFAPFFRLRTTIHHFLLLCC